MEENVNALIEGLEKGDPGAAPADATQLPEGMTMESFQEAFTKVTGLDSIDRVNELRSYQERFDAAHQELEQLRARQPEDPFANDFARNINDMLKSGKGASEIIPFINLQMQDFASMDHESAIKMQMKLDNPGLSDADIDILFSDTYPAPPEDAENAAHLASLRNAKIKQAGNVARQQLEKRKVDMSLPEQGAPVRNVEMEARVASFQKLAKAVSSRMSEIPVKLVDDKSGINYNLNYRPNISDEEMSGIVEQVSKAHAGRGTKLDEAGLRQVQQDIEFLVRAKTMQDREEAIIRDAWASAAEHFAKFYSNPEPPRRGSGTPPPTKKGPEATIKHKGKYYV